MSRISLIWQEPLLKEVTISARELAILAGRSPGDAPRASRQLCFGVSTEAVPSSMAQGYAQWLGQLQQDMEKKLGVSVAFSLKLFKRFNEDDKSLARDEADLMILSAVNYLKAKARSPGVTAIARDRSVREAVIFVHTNSGVQRLNQLSGKSLAFPDPNLSVSVWAKARLATAGLQTGNLRSCTNIIDRGPETGEAVISLYEIVNSVLKREVDGGATYRDRFERYKHLGLVMLDVYPETPNVLAARQGLDASIVGALRNAVQLLKGKAGFDSLPLSVPSEMVPVEESYFADLRRALRQAEQFEGRSRE